jgi:hypothetical protein
VSSDRTKIYRLSDGRIIGGAGNSFDVAAWRDWLEGGKPGGCPILSDQFCGLILTPTGETMWVDHKGRELATPTPCAIGSGQDVAIGAMEAGAPPEHAVAIAIRRDPFTGGEITVLSRE